MGSQRTLRTNTYLKSTKRKYLLVRRQNETNVFVSLTRRADTRQQYNWRAFFAVNDGSGEERLRYIPTMREVVDSVHETLTRALFEFFSRFFFVRCEEKYRTTSCVFHEKTRTAIGAILRRRQMRGGGPVQLDIYGTFPFLEGYG